MPMTKLSDGSWSDESPVHGWFELSYANYYVIPRALLEAMPLEWQREWVKLQEQFESEFDLRGNGIDLRYDVQKRDEHGRFVSDPLSNYRRPNFALIESMRRSKDAA